MVQPYRTKGGIWNLHTFLSEAKYNERDEVNGKEFNLIMPISS
jgi:hypothetical protein